MTEASPFSNTHIIKKYIFSKLCIVMKIIASVILNLIQKLTHKLNHKSRKYLIKLISVVKRNVIR